MHHWFNFHQNFLRETFISCAKYCMCRPTFFFFLQERQSGLGGMGWTYIYPKYNNTVPLPLPLSLKSWRYFVDIRIEEENYRFRKPFFIVLGREREGEQKAARDVTFRQRYEGNEKSMSLGNGFPGSWGENEMTYLWSYEPRPVLTVPHRASDLWGWYSTWTRFSIYLSQ